MMKSLERLGLPQSPKSLHQATMAGLSVELTTRLVEELGIESCVVASWIDITAEASRMTPVEGDAFCRRADERLESDQVAATRWLTSPNIALGNVQPVSLLSTEAGDRAVR